MLDWAVEHGVNTIEGLNTRLARGEFSEIVFESERSGRLPVPAVYLVDDEGSVLFHYVNPNYRIRLVTELLLAAAEVNARARD